MEPAATQQQRTPRHRRLGITEATDARREIERSDAAHAGIARSFFGVDWQNPLLYQGRCAWQPSLRAAALLQ